MLVTAEKILVESVKATSPLHLSAGWQAFDFLGQKGVAEGTSADHPSVNSCKTSGEGLEGGKIIDVAVIDERMAAEILADSKTVGIGIAFVKLFAEAGMDNDFFEWESVEFREQSCQLRGKCVAKAGLDRDSHLQMRQYLLQNGDDGFRVGQEA